MGTCKVYCRVVSVTMDYGAGCDGCDREDDDDDDGYGVSAHCHRMLEQLLGVRLLPVDPSNREL